MKSLFAPILNRSELLAIPVKECVKPVTVAVHRNHSFELTASILPVFLAQSGLSIKFVYSSYDDSLSSVDTILDADAHLFWLNAKRYTIADFSDWLKERIASCRKATGKPVVLACHGVNLGGAFDGLVCNMPDILAHLGDKAENYRLESLSGTPLSNLACLEMARALGMHYLPSLFLPCLKALALDCDNTLYDGVLGEDGIDGVRPRMKVMKKLRELANQGFLLTLVSKNEEDDVRELFSKRADFPLRWDDFTAVAINWNNKAENIQKLAEKMNIGLDSILFLDDNPGELLNVRQAIPEIHYLEASNEEGTVQGLKHYPLLFKSSINYEDSLRNNDIQANTKREFLHKTLSPEEYRRELGISLCFEFNPIERLTRIIELLNKTNQFIFRYMRPNRECLEKELQEGTAIITASMSDRLSDSGLIAILVAAINDQRELLVKELVVSCRALGRGVENGMIAKMLELACEHLHCHSINFPWKRGPRNQPAITWLGDFCSTVLEGESGKVAFSHPAYLKDALAGVSIKMKLNG